MIDTILQDLRYALRTLQRAPLFTLVAVLTLGLGIGATTVVFTILNGVVLRPLQYEASDRLFGIWEQNEQGNYRLGSYPAFRDWRAQSEVFEALAYIRGSSALMPGHEGARRVGAAFVSDEFFDVLRGPPLLGRLCSPEEQRPGGAPVAVLTHALWHEAFGCDRSAIGSTIRLNEATYTVVGVLPDWFQFPSWAGVYLPLSTVLPTDRILAQRGFHADSRIVAKLKPDVSIKQAQAAMAAIQARLATAYPVENRGWTRVEFVSLFEEELQFGAVRPVLVLLAAAVAAVLLLACANVANMTLVRAARRSRELAIRAALGAGRGRVARLLLTEAILVVLAGAGLGLLVAWWATGVVRATAPAGLPRASEIALDARMLGFTALISLLVTVASGLAPAVRPPMPDLSPPPRYDAPERAVALYQRVAGAIAALPGVKEVALSNHLPLSGAYLPRPIEIPGRQPDAQNDQPVLFRTISAEYFETLRIPMRSGRVFTATDVALASHVAIINDALARRYWPKQNPVGTYITLFKSAQARADFGQRFSVEIIGVVSDVRHTGLQNEPSPEVYIPYTLNPWGYMNVVVRTAGDPDALLPVLPRVISAIDPDIPVTGAQRPAALTDVVSGQLARERLTVTVLSGFASGALLLAALGIFGVIAYVVTLRTREFGVRAALGATPRQIVRLVIRQTLWIVTTGLVLGLAAALALTRLMVGLLYNVPPRDAA